MIPDHPCSPVNLIHAEQQRLAREWENEPQSLSSPTESQIKQEPYKNGSHAGIDLTGRRFGKLIVIRMVKSQKFAGRIWLCKCDCGTVKTVRGGDLKTGYSKSCGCDFRKYVNGHKKPHGESAFNVLFGQYQRMAKNRGCEWSLSREEFRHLASSDCAYCGAPPKTEMFRIGLNGAFAYNGLDRVKNSDGYTTENAVPCCAFCNMAKRTYSLEEFSEWIERIHKFKSSIPEFPRRRAYKMERRAA
jgi:hypothetical protein